MKYKIPFIRPHFPSADDLVADFRQIQENNWFTNFGPFENELCSSISDIYQTEAHVTTIANATLGLEAVVGILLRDTGERNEILVPSFTFAAGPEVLIKAGLKPVFIDIEADSWQPSIDQASNYLKDNNAKVGGILLCNIFGVGNDRIAEWENLANEFSIPLIIDSAAGFGSLYSETQKVGLRGNCEIFSMHATKPFSVGEGGLVISKNAELIKKVRSYQNFGFDENRTISMMGTNAKLQELNCAIGLRQLDNFEQRLAARRRSLESYRQNLKPIGYDFMKNDNLSTVCFASTLAPTSSQAANTHLKLSEAGVEVRRYYAPLHMQESIMTHSAIAVDMKITEDVFSRILSLPIHDEMSAEDIAYINNIIIDQSGR